MKRFLIGIFALFVGLIFLSDSGSEDLKKSEKGKYAIILQAGTETHEGRARALHSLMYSLELKQAGNDVVLIFDGAGTEWIEAFTNPEKRSGFENMFKMLKDAGVVQVICDFCATAFKVHKNLEERKLPMESDFLGHPSIAKWTSQGYQIIVL